MFIGRGAHLLACLGLPCDFGQLCLFRMHGGDIQHFAHFN